MVTVRAHKVIVVRDETTRISREVWEWELPVLEAAHQEGFVILQEDGVIEAERESLPDAAEEYDRLTRVYGTEAGGGRDLTEVIYGYRKKGIDKLEKAIEGSVVGATAVKAKPKKPKKKPAPKKEPAEAPADPFGDI